MEIKYPVETWKGFLKPKNGLDLPVLTHNTKSSSKWQPNCSFLLCCIYSMPVSSGTGLPPFPRQLYAHPLSHTFPPFVLFLHLPYMFVPAIMSLLPPFTYAHVHIFFKKKIAMKIAQDAHKYILMMEAESGTWCDSVPSP